MSLPDFFLKHYQFNNEYERRKTISLLYINLVMLLFFAIIALMQESADMGNIILIGNITAFFGMLVTLYFIYTCRPLLAGNMIVISCLTAIVVADLLDDWLSAKQQSEYKIYVSLVALLGTYILCLSFFRTKRLIYIYAVVGVLILTAHTLIVYYHPLHTPEIRTALWGHFTVAVSGIIISAIIFNFLISATEDLMEENIANTQKIKLQNDNLELQVAERTRELKASNDSLKEFAHVVSHDLKEPLRTISGFVTLIDKRLLSDYSSDDVMKDYATHILKSTKQMETLIRDLLTYSKLNVQEKNFTYVDVNVIVNDVVKLLQKSIEEQDAQIVIDKLPGVKSAPSLLFQLYQNLISNALKYVSLGQKPIVHIGVEKNAAGKSVYFVKDSGIGISERYYDTIFHAFKRLHNKATYEGTGIGLAICKRIVEIHGGKIEVVSKENEGSTFMFTLEP
jgi:signal transduction histidine kinase